jgi:hypothetical protein
MQSHAKPRKDRDMKDYSIKRAHRAGDTYNTMIIIDNHTDEQIAEYRIDDNVDAAIRSMRRALDKHLADGGTLGNYQW